MSTTQWILSVSLLAWALLRNLGTRPVNRMTFLLPLVVVVTVGGFFLFPLPTSGNDLLLVTVATLVGSAFGVAAALATKVHNREDSVHLSAGWVFAALWLVLVAGRVTFAEWATHSGAQSVGRFSMEHHITGAAAWTTAFVAMALAMVLVRTVWLSVSAARAGRQSDERVLVAA